MARADAERIIRATPTFQKKEAEAAERIATTEKERLVFSAQQDMKRDFAKLLEDMRKRNNIIGAEEASRLGQIFTPETAPVPVSKMPPIDYTPQQKAPTYVNDPNVTRQQKAAAAAQPDYTNTSDVPYGYDEEYGLLYNAPTLFTAAKEAPKPEASKLPTDEKALVNTAFKDAFISTVDGYYDRKYGSLEESIEAAHAELITKGYTGRQAQEALNSVLQRGDLLVAAPGTKDYEIATAIRNGNYDVLAANSGKEGVVNKSTVVKAPDPSRIEAEALAREKFAYLNNEDARRARGEWVDSVAYKRNAEIYTDLAEALGWGAIPPATPESVPTPAPAAFQSSGPGASGTADQAMLNDAVQKGMDSGYQFDIDASGGLSISLSEALQGAESGDPIYTQIYQALRPMYPNMNDAQFAEFARQN